MCGICGIYSFDGPIDNPAIIISMAETMEHRGPDGQGFFFNSKELPFSSEKDKPLRGEGAGNVVLGHRRLSIIDLEGGKQPLSNEDETVWVTYNGEIYNFPSLITELSAKGHWFRTRCDTEVIVHAYEEWGSKCVEHFRGMFAFAIWDIRDNAMFLARDRLGIKPLYYYIDARTVIFGSEIKALLASKLPERALDPYALYDYLTLMYIPAPRSIFRHIKKLPAGHTVTIKAGTISQPKKYWDISFAHVDYAKSEEEWCEEIIEKLREAIGIRLVSDVPLGAFLSGGVDSSAVVALMSELSTEPVKTSSIGFGEQKFNELDYAALMVKLYGTDHQQQIVRSSAVDLLDKLAWYYDEPFADSSALPTYLVSHITRERVTVALSGDGGDENFAGYRRYFFDLLENRLRSIFPAYLRSTLIAALARLYPKADWLPQMLRAKTLLTNLSLSPVDGYFNSMSWFGPYREKILSQDIRASIGEYSPAQLFQKFGEQCDSDDPLSRIQYIDIKTYLVDDILAKVDRASMANSLEVRVPVLDHEFMELAAMIPPSLKLKGREGKYIFKKALHSRVPQDILYRPKMGFSIPLSQWLRNELKPVFEAHVFDFNSTVNVYLNMDTVREMWRKHQAKVNDFSSELWTILFFAIWADRFIRKHIRPAHWG